MNYVSAIWMPKTNLSIPKIDGYSLIPKQAITDSGTSFAYFPDVYYQAIMKKVLKLVVFKQQVDGLYVISCLERKLLPPIYLLYGGYWIEMKASDYILETQGQCSVCLLSNG